MIKERSRRIIKLALIMVLVVIVATGCLPGDGSYIDDHYANFLSGVWHGWMAPLSLVLGFFRDDIRLYEVYNTGWWYDFGFYIAVISGFGGLSLRRKRKKED